MTPNEKDLMERYIYQVIRRLSKAQREEVRMELEELISDMYTDKGSMEEVLTQLGDPAKFAGQFQSGQQYLIGPEYFDTYLWFIKVILICTVVPILVISLVNAFGLASVITSQNAAPVIIHAIVDGLTVVTLIFAIMEHQKVKIEIKRSEKWSVEKLTKQKKITESRWTPSFLEPVPDKKALINRGDSIVGIVFIVIFCVLLIFAPHFFAAFFRKTKPSKRCLFSI